MPQPKPLPPLETLREVLAYDPDTGALTWLVDRSSNARAGSPAGCYAGSNGYTQVCLGLRRFKAHRLAWYLHHGEDPGALQVDHINRNRSDNRICNLRLVDAKGNRANSPALSPVQVLWPSGQVSLFPSTQAAARALSCAPSSVYRYANGLRQHPAGLVVRYANA
jgi:hypothetical protein